MLLESDAFKLSYFLCAVCLSQIGLGNRNKKKSSYHFFFSGFFLIYIKYYFLLEAEHDKCTIHRKIEQYTDL